MKKLRMLKTILRQTHSDKILLSYLLCVLGVALVVLLAEQDITSYGDALWYCYEVISTTSFGEFMAMTFVTRIASVFLTCYTLIAVGIITGVITNFYIQLTQLRNDETVTAFVDKLERLPQLSKEELTLLSDQVKKRRNKS